MSARLQWMQLLIEMFSVVTDAFEMSHLLQDMLVIVEGGMCFLLQSQFEGWAMTDIVRGGLCVMLDVFDIYFVRCFGFIYFGEIAE